MGDHAMKWLNPIIVLTSCYLLVFIQTSLNPVGYLTGTQADLLPVLMVYAGLSMDGISIVLLALAGGLWLDSFSLNPLGASVLPLLLIGWVFHGYREYILRDQVFAQMVLGGVACVVVSVLTLIVIYIIPESTRDYGLDLDGGGVELVSALPFAVARKVLGGWQLLEQVIIKGASGAVFAPILFGILAWVHHSFDYPASVESSFRADREIKRGSEI
jgi:rod shape-determining protein MreD